MGIDVQIALTDKAAVKTGPEAEEREHVIGHTETCFYANITCAIKAKHKFNRGFFYFPPDLGPAL